jgi:hypothetical protein
VKDTIFISHANPEDNYFASWLSSKLSVLGYKVWVDVNAISPGHYFNNNFEHVIRQESIKFLAVISSSYLDKAAKDDSGVMNEILAARTVKEPGFIIPILIDDSNYSDFSVGLIGRQAITFHKNWGKGLAELLAYFEEISTPKLVTTSNVLQFWHEAQRIVSSPYEKRERHYTNWFEAFLPREIHLHRIQIFGVLDFKEIPFAYVNESNWIICFADQNAAGAYFTIEESKVFDLVTFSQTSVVALDPITKMTDIPRKIVRLLNRTLSSHLDSRGFIRYRQSGRKDVFILANNEQNRKSISLKKFNKSRRSLIGKSGDFVWFFGISFNFSQEPVNCFRISYHLIFRDNRGNFLGPDLQHELRRSVPSDWYNKEWFEKLIAFTFAASGQDPYEMIRVSINANTEVAINVLPLELTSNVGYNEPGHES